MSPAVAVFLWCVLALLTGAAGLALIGSGLWELGSAFLLAAIVFALITRDITKEIEK